MSKYQRVIYGINPDDKRGMYIDVYSVFDAFAPDQPRVGQSAIEHAVKKLLCPGMRGHKDELKDLKEAKASIQRAIEQQEQQAACEKV